MAKRRKIEKPIPLTHTSFAGRDGEAQNALRSALHTAARSAGHEGEYAEYRWLEQTPRTSVVVGLVDALQVHGYQIVKRKGNGRIS